MMLMPHLTHALVSLPAPCRVLRRLPSIQGKPLIKSVFCGSSGSVLGLDIIFLPSSPCSAGNSEGAPSTSALPARGELGGVEVGKRADGDRFEGGARPVGADLGDRLCRGVGKGRGRRPG